MVEHRVKNFGEYVEIIKEVTLGDNKILWFRGHADHSWNLQPSVWRNYSRDDERAMNHEFLWKAKSRTLRPPIDKDWSSWLSLMQHYRLPTRLLDWSKSPLVALYFAIEQSILSLRKEIPNTDAAVWLLCPGELNVVSGLEPYIFSIQTGTARDMIEPAFLNPQRVKENDKIIAVSAIEDDIRMMVQQAAFTIHSSLLPLENYCDVSRFLKKIIIPKESIPSMSIEMDILGIKQSMIYPDLENLALEIQRRYSRLTGHPSTPKPNKP